jgi:hypothetical protein
MGFGSALTAEHWRGSISEMGIELLQDAYTASNGQMMHILPRSHFVELARGDHGA